MDSTSYFNQRGRYSVYKKVYCKGTRVSHKGGSVESSRGQIVLYRESVGNSDGHVEYRKAKLCRRSVEHRKGRITYYYSKTEYGRQSEYNGTIAYRRGNIEYSIPEYSIGIYYLHQGGTNLHRDQHTTQLGMHCIRYYPTFQFPDAPPTMLIGTNTHNFKCLTIPWTIPIGNTYNTTHDFK